MPPMQQKRSFMADGGTGVSEDGRSSRRRRGDGSGPMRSINQAHFLPDSDENGTDGDREVVLDDDFCRLILSSQDELLSDFKCPICLGIIKNTRVVMECQHRFCKECIDKELRLGNKECPTCRRHFPTRRSLREDPAFDGLIQALFPDVEEELVFGEEERALNDKFQASMREVSERQAIALNKKRKETEAAESDPRMSHSSSNSTRTRNTRGTATQRYPIQFTSSTSVNLDNAPEHVMPLPDAPEPVVPLPKPEVFTWGRGGSRSHSQHGSGSSSRNT